MTSFGKLLAVLNLIAGIGMVVTATVLYSQRPPWFDEAAGTSGPWDGPASFAQINARMNGDKDTLGEIEKANSTSRTWGARLTELKSRETFRATRQAEFDRRLKWAHLGNPNKGGAAFFRQRYYSERPADPKAGLIISAKLVPPGFKPDQLIDIERMGDDNGNPEIGPDNNQPLQGADTKLAQFNKDADAVVEVSKEIAQSRQRQVELAQEVKVTEARFVKQGEIRDTIVNELYFLDGFEVNTLEQRDTVLRRREQLRQQLMRLGGVPGK